MLGALPCLLVQLILILNVRSVSSRSSKGKWSGRGGPGGQWEATLDRKLLVSYDVGQPLEGTGTHPQQKREAVGGGSSHWDLDFRVKKNLKKRLNIPGMLFFLKKRAADAAGSITWCPYPKPWMLWNPGKVEAGSSRTIKTLGGP